MTFRRISGCNGCIQGFFFGRGYLRERDHLEDVSVNGRVILEWISKKWDGGMAWFDLSRDWDRWRALVNAVMNLRVTHNVGNFVTS